MREMRKNWVYRRGDIYMANLNPFRGSEQRSAIYSKQVITCLL